MKMMLTACVLALTAGVGFAQTTTDREGVTTSTDPARAAAVERHVAELKSQSAQPAPVSAGPSAHRVKKAHAGRRPAHAKAVSAK